MRELVSEPLGSGLPPSSHAVGTTMDFSWDAYRWADFMPRGARVDLALSVGVFLGATVLQSRHSSQLDLVVAQPLARYTVLTARGVGVASTRGNAGFSQPLGSIGGVRGLADGLYRNWLQAVVNSELRQAPPVADRWAAQAVLFADMAAFEQIDPNGSRGRRGSALSFGGGARVIPTWLANVVLRLDLARLVVPSQTWLLQFGEFDEPRISARGSRCR